MTKRDFLNALIDPTHADVKIKLRTLRKELRGIGWKLKYRYHKDTHTFYLMMSPATVTFDILTGRPNYEDAEVGWRRVFRFLVPLTETSKIDMNVSRERRGAVYSDIYIVS